MEVGGFTYPKRRIGFCEIRTSVEYLENEVLKGREFRERGEKMFTVHM